MGHGGTDLSFGSVRRKANVVRLTCILTQGDDDGNLPGDHHDVVHSHYFHSIVIHNPTTPDSTPHGQYTARSVHRPLVSTIFTTKSANRDRQPCLQWKSPGHQKGDTWLGSFHDAERAYLRRTHSGWDEPFFIDTKLHGYIWAYTYRG